MIVKKILNVLLGAGALLTVWSAPAGAETVTRYGYVPDEPVTEELYYYGSSRDKSNQYVECAVAFDPATDPAWARMSGYKVTGVRVYLQHPYKQKSKKRSLVSVRVNDLTSTPVATEYVNFTEGWNDVMFSTPVEITSTDKLYLGAQVFETLDATHPFASWRYAESRGDNCKFNVRDSGKGSWTEFDNRGSLMLMALTDAPEEVVGGAGMAMLSDYNGIVTPGVPFKCNLRFLNRSASPVSSAEVHIQGEGTDQTLNLTFDTPVASYGYATVPVEVKAPVTEGKSVPLYTNIKSLNGQAAPSVRPVEHLLYISGEEYVRIPVLEEFTSLACVNCPLMYYYLEEAIKTYRNDYEGRVIFLGRHSGFVEDYFTTQSDRALLYLFNGPTYNPALMVNRTIYGTGTTPVVGATQMSSDIYLEAIFTGVSTTSPATISVEPLNNIGASKVGARITGQVNSAIREDIDSVRVSVFLVENNIPEPWYPQSGLDDAPADVVEGYMHNGVIRAVYNQDPVGDRIAIDADGNFSIEYDEQAVDTEEVVPANCELVAVLHRTDRKNIQGNYVLNGSSSCYGTADGSGGILGGTGGINTVTVAEQVTFTVDGAGMIIPSRPVQWMRIYDPQGRGYPLNLTLTPGIYLVSYQAAGMKTPGSAKLIVK